MALPIYVGKAASVTGTGAIVLSLPTGWAVGDLLLMYVNTKATETFITPSGWTLVGTAIPSAGSRVTVLSRVAVSGDTTFMPGTIGGDHMLGFIEAYRHPYGGTLAITNLATDLSSTPVTFVPLTSSATTSPDRIVIKAMATDQDFSGSNLGSMASEFAAYNLHQLTKRTDEATSTGEGGGLIVWAANSPLPNSFTYISGNLAVARVVANVAFAIGIPYSAITITAAGAGSLTFGEAGTVTLETWGAGGAGGRRSRGAGGGAYAKSVVPYALGQTLYYSVAAATAGTITTTGGTGADSWARVGTNSAPTGTTDGALAKGGTGGTASVNGTGGTTAASFGTTEFAGGNGSSAGSGTTQAGGGGGGAGPTNAGGAASSNTAGAGGASGATGGTGGSGATGGAGVAPGGGGAATSNATGTGGAGGRGQFRYTFAPLPKGTVTAISTTADDGNTASATPTAFTNSAVISGAVSPNWNDAGFRFRNIAVPIGATVLSATLQLNQTTNITGNLGPVFGVDEDNAAAFTATTRLPSNLPHTDMSTDLLGVGTGTTLVDVTDVIAEIVARSGWASGNSISLITDHAFGAPDSQATFSDFTASSALCARLYIELIPIEYALTATSISSSSSVTTPALASAAPSSALTLFDHSGVAPAMIDNDFAQYILGVTFIPKVQGRVTHVSFYRNPLDPTTSRTVAIFERGGGFTTLATGDSSGETMVGGWVSVPLSTPFAVTPGMEYIVGVQMHGQHYVATSAYFVNPGGAGYENDSLILPNTGTSITLPGGSSSLTLNGMYKEAVEVIEPTDSFNATNYWIDIEFVPSWTPANLAVAPHSWHDASNVATITQSSGLVSQITELGGTTARNLTASGSDRPTFSASGMGGSLPGILGSSSTGMTTPNLSDFGLNGSHFATFMAYRTLTGGGYYDRILSMGSSTGDYSDHTHFNIYSFPDPSIGITANNTDSPQLPRTANTNSILSGIGNGTDLRLWVDGVDTYTISGAPALNIDRMGVLIQYDQFAAYAAGANWGENIVLGYTPTTDERQKIEGYLAWKWNSVSSLAVGHPYKSAPPTLSSTPSAVDLTANPVASSSSVSTPTLVQNHVLTATAVASASSVTTPALVRNVALTATAVASSSTVSTPALVRNNVLTATAVASSSSVSTPALLRNHVLTANPVVSSSTVSNPALLRNNVLTATAVASASSVTTPAVSQNHALTATAVASQSTVTTPSLAQQHVLTGTAVSSQPTTGSPAIAQQHALTASPVASQSTVSAPTLAAGTTLNPVAVASQSTVGTPALAQEHALTTQPVASASSVTTPALVQNRVLTANPVASQSSVSTPALSQQHALTATAVASSSTVSNPLAARGHVLTAQPVASTSTVTSPAIAQQHNLSASNVASQSTVSNPALLRNHVLTANPVASSSTMSVPALLQQHALTAQPVASSSTVSNPTLSSGTGLTPVAIASQSTVGTPAIAQEHALATQSVASGSTVSTPAIVQNHALAALGVSSASTVDAPFLRQNHAFAPPALASQSSVTTPALAGNHVLTTQPVVSSALLTVPTLVQNHALGAQPVLSSSILSVPILRQQHGLSAPSIFSGTSVAAALLRQNHILMPQGLHADSFVTTPELLVSVGLHGFMQALVDGEFMLLPAYAYRNAQWVSLSDVMVWRDNQWIPITNA